MTDASPLGHARAAALDAAAGLGLTAGAVTVDADQVAWAAAQLGQEDGRSLVGVDVAGVPLAWRPVLAAAGVPLAVGGALAWQAQVDPALAQPALVDGQLSVPPLAVMQGLTSMPLRDLRDWVAAGTGVRVRLAVGVRLWLAADRAVLVNLTAAEQAGFLHGPRHGMRAGIALDPGGIQVLTW